MYDLVKFEDKYGDKIDLRVATIDDCENIFNGQNTAFPDDPSNLSVDDIKEYIVRAEHSFIVGFFDGQFAGYVATHSKKFRPWMNGNSLVVIKEYAGKGIGAFLLREAILSCRKIMIRIFVEKNNYRAIRLYKRFGFFRIQKFANHYENGEDALVMVKWTLNGRG